MCPVSETLRKLILTIHSLLQDIDSFDEVRSQAYMRAEIQRTKMREVGNAETIWACK